MSKIKLSELPAKFQQSVQRQASKDLGKGNGETVKVHIPDTGTKEVWYRTASKGAQIVEVTAIKVTPNWLALLDEQGHVEDVSRLDEAIQYHRTREEAVHAVRRRLTNERDHHQIELTTFELKEDIRQKQLTNPGAREAL